MTSRLVLAYAQREGGKPAVERVLELAGCTGREAELLDERSWFSFDLKIRLFEALAEALDDPVVTRHAGEAALDLSVGDGLKVALRALGSPRLVYQHIVRANGKFSAIHDMELLSLGRDRATISFADNASVDYGVHRLDCEYNKGLLSVVPALFGMGHAHVSHTACAAEGADRCVYELSWQHSRLTMRNTVATGAAATAGVAAAALAAPALLPVAA
ncbi:MAG TPA: hypothetical protein VN238_00140, partial [Solirubrobacteraceae bacterium]|nr:hypothetical protein [Solirubrobacteraceae bacterium]